MRRTIRNNLVRLALAAVMSLLGPGAVRADAPGYEFMMLPEGMAMVVDQGGRATKAKISEDTAEMLTTGAQPLSDSGIVLLYHGRLYIVPDRQLGDGKMLSSRVMPSASDTRK